jgi:hypothetical protein
MGSERLQGKLHAVKWYCRNSLVHTWCTEQFEPLLWSMTLKGMEEFAYFLGSKTQEDTE